MFPTVLPVHHYNTTPPAPSSCRLVCKWQINTQLNAAVGKTPYELAFGQLPKCGLSGLPIANDILKVLPTNLTHSCLIPTHKHLMCRSHSPLSLI